MDVSGFWSVLKNKIMDYTCVHVSICIPKGFLFVCLFKKKENNSSGMLIFYSDELSLDLRAVRINNATQARK